MKLGLLKWGFMMLTHFMVITKDGALVLLFLVHQYTDTNGVIIGVQFSIAPKGTDVGYSRTVNGTTIEVNDD